ncbi:hypothetical protein [Yeosuana marina]|uniref:hypothetical protein n=1 Tax=Yeosuana marina TaxID=1565536 RepID=UPI0014210EF8|nr:hypothetical protein [Yeosuana marina]
MKSFAILLIFLISNLLSFNLVYSQERLAKTENFTQLDLDNYKIDSDIYNFWWYMQKYKWFPKGDTLPYFVDDRDYKGLINYGMDYSLINRMNFAFTENVEMYKLDVKINVISFNPKDSIFNIQGLVKGGWDGKNRYNRKGDRNDVDVFIGQKKDTINNLYLNDLHDPKEYNVTYKGEKAGSHIILDSFSSFYLHDYKHSKTTFGNERKFNIQSKINKNSILVFGSEYCYAEIFEIGKLIFSKKEKTNLDYKNRKEKRNLNPTVIIRNNVQVSNEEKLSKPKIPLYYAKIDQAENFIWHKQYGKAKEIYDVFLKDNKYMFARDIHNAVRCSIIARDYNTSISWCEKLALKGVPITYFDAKIFDGIKKNILWQTFLKKYPSLNKEYNDGLNHKLINRLKELVTLDQIDYIKNSRGEIEKAQLIKTTEFIDGEFINLIEKEGFPTEEKVGVVFSQDSITIGTSPEYFVLIVHSHQISSSRLSEIKELIKTASEKLEYDAIRDNLNVFLKGGNTCFQIYKGNLYNSKSCNPINQMQVNKIAYKFNNKYGFIIDNGSYIIIPYENETKNEDEKFFNERYDFIMKLTDDWFFYEH